MQYIRKSSFASFTFELTNCDGSPVDLSNSRVLFAFKQNREDDDSIAILSKSYENSTTNIVSFEFTAEETKNINVDKGYLALKIYVPSGNHDEVWNDEVKIIKGVLND